MPWTLKFEFRVTPYFHSDLHELEFELEGRPAVLKAFDQEKLLNEAQWVVIRIRDFSSEQEAWDFGAKLQAAAAIAGPLAGFGLDVGRNETRSATSQQIKDAFRLSDGRELRDRIHGIDVYEGSGPVSIFSMSGEIRIAQRPEAFFGELGARFGYPMPAEPSLERALRLVGEAPLHPDIGHQFILAVTAVEALAQDPAWSDAQQAQIAKLLSDVQPGPELSEVEAAEIRERLGSLRRSGVLAGMRRLLREIGVDDHWKPWIQIYNLRSKVLHGRVEVARLQDLAHDALQLSRYIVLSAISYENGMPRPTPPILAAK